MILGRSKKKKTGIHQDPVQKAYDVFRAALSRKTRPKSEGKKKK